METAQTKKAFTRVPKLLRAVLFYLIQWTWGLPQNLAGLALLLLLGRQKRARMHGALVTLFDKNRIMNDRGAVSLGTFIFIPESWGEEQCRRTAVHEYGHTVQSMILGPFYLFAVGIPSVIWANRWAISRRKARLAAKNGATAAADALTSSPKKAQAKRYLRIASAPYTSRYPENWANDLGEYVTGEEPPRD